MEIKIPIVIDNGSGITKAGFAGENKPNCIFPTIVGYPKHQYVACWIEPRNYYIGEEAIKKRGMLHLKYPTNCGKVLNWDEIEKIQFEKFHVPSCCLAIQASLALYSTGQTTGVVLDCGDDFTQIVPIYDGYLLQNGMIRMNWAGKDITKYLARLLMEKGFSFTTTAEFQLVQEIKEKLCYTSFHYKADVINHSVRNGRVRQFTLPDGQNVSVGYERFHCPEILFKPYLLGSELNGIHTSLFNSIMKCEVDIRRTLFSNIYLMGGTASMPGMMERLYREMYKLVPLSMKIRILPSENMKIASWLGGSLIASIPAYETMWITKQEYAEYGKSIIFRKYT